MNYYLVLLVLSVSTKVNLTNACQFGSEAIQAVYDRFELFRKTKAFDPTDPEIPLEQYHFYNSNGVNTIAVEINGVYMTESYETDEDDKVKTRNGQYQIVGKVILNYKRDEDGQFTFDDWSSGKKFDSSLRSIDADLPNDFEEDYKQVLVDLNGMRKKMFDFQKSLSREDIERVGLFDFSSFPEGGFYAQYIDNEGGSLSVSQQNGSEDISGRLSCQSMDQKYNIVDGKVVADGEPFVPWYD